MPVDRLERIIDFVDFVYHWESGRLAYVLQYDTSGTDWNGTDWIYVRYPAGGRDEWRRASAFMQIVSYLEDLPSTSSGDAVADDDDADDGFVQNDTAAAEDAATAATATDEQQQTQDAATAATATEHEQQQQQQ